MKNCLLLLCLLCLAMHSHAQIIFNPGKTVAPSSSGNEHPRIVTDRGGNPLIIWHHASRCMFTRWNGTAFTAPVMLNPTNMMVAGADWMGPDVAAHGDTVYVVFKRMPEAADTSRIYCTRSVNGGLSFSPPVLVDNIDDSISRFPTITTDDVGNPIIGFMKFDPDFANARWVVTRSPDMGATFLQDVKASGWSSQDATVCDCCPGGITAKGNSVAMMYRDNNSNIRDTWAGISANNGATFSGLGIDQQNWMLMACPSTGPDGVIVGDTLYSTFMNGAGGSSRVFYSKTSVSSMNSSNAIPLSSSISGLSLQNYPRVATDGRAMAFAWKQVVNGTEQSVLRFSNDITQGLPPSTQLVDQNDVTNCDVTIRNGMAYVVWQDDNSGTLRFRSGSFTPVTEVAKEVSVKEVSVYPNPTTSQIMVATTLPLDRIIITDVIGERIYEEAPNQTFVSVSLKNPGVYFITTTSGQKVSTTKLIVTF